MAATAESSARGATLPVSDKHPHESGRFLAVVALVGLCMGMTAPLTVLYAKSLGASPTVAGFAVASLGISLLVVDLLGMTVVPRLPGRLLVVAALVVFGLGAVASALAPSLWVMIACRVAQGFGAALFMSGGLHVVLRNLPHGVAGVAIGRFNSWWFAGIALGPTVGGGLAGLLPDAAGFRLAFAANGGLCLTAAVLARLGLRRMPSPLPPRIGWPRMPRSRPGARLWPAMSVATAAQAVRSSAAPTVLPLLGAAELGLDVALVGVALSVLAVVDVLAMSLAGRVADRPRRRSRLVIAFAVGAAVCAAVPLVAGAPAFVAWCALLALSLGFTWIVPQAMLVDASADRESGVNGYRVASDGAMLVSPVGAGAVVGSAGPVGGVLVIGGVLALAGIGTLLAPDRGSPRRASPGEDAPGPGDRRAEPPVVPLPTPPGSP